MMVRSTSQLVQRWIAVAALVLLFAAPAWAQRLPTPRLPAPPAAAPAQPADGSTTAPAPKAPPVNLPTVTLNARMDRPTVRQGETVKLVITLTWDQPATKTAVPLDFKFPDPPKADGLTLFGNSFHAETSLTGSTVRVSRVYEYEFTASREIETTIAPLKITYSAVGSKDSRELTTVPLTVKVTKPPLKLKQTLRNPILIVILVLAVVGSIAALVLPGFRRRREQALMTEPELSVHDKARLRLREIERLRLAGEYGEYLHRLAQEFHHYLEAGLGVKARSADATQLAAAVAERAGEEWTSRVLDFEALLDKVKFAGFQPDTAQLDRAARTVSELIDRTEILKERSPEGNASTGGK